MLGGVILKLEEIEGAASEKDGGSGRGGIFFFFFCRENPLVPVAPNTLKSGGVDVGEGGGGVIVFCMENPY